jgi:hypothetical protein
MKKIISASIIVAVVMAGSIMFFLRHKIFSTASNRQFTSTSDGVMISSSGDVKVFDKPGDNPLCGNIMVVKNETEISSFVMCEENITDVSYGSNTVTLKTDGGMSKQSKFITVDLLTGKIKKD